MRDFRIDYLHEVELRLASLDPDTHDLVMAAITGVLDKYELSERSTEVVPYDTGNDSLLKTYAGTLLIDGKAKSTITGYIRELRKLARFIGGKDLKTTCTFDIRNYLAQEKVRGISGRSLENERSYISTFFQWLANEQYITVNPCAAISSIKYADEVKTPFSAVELDTLRSSCKTKKERAIIEVLASSGVRVSELTALDIEDIDFQKKSVRVRHGKGDKERYTYIDSVARNHLIKYLTEAGITSGALFPSKRKNRYTAGGIRTLLNVIAARAGVENVHPHRFRRTFATRLAARGMAIQEIQRLMGHTDINTTMTYIYMDDAQIVSSYMKHTA